MARDRQRDGLLPRQFGRAGGRGGRGAVDADGIDAGRLTERVALERPVTAQNEFGEHTRSWQTFAEVWACVEQTGGAESTQAGQTHAAARYAVTIRYLGGVDEKMRVRLLRGGAVLGVDSVEDFERRGVALILACVEDKQRG